MGMWCVCSVSCCLPTAREAWTYRASGPATASSCPLPGSSATNSQQACTPIILIWIKSGSPSILCNPIRVNAPWLYLKGWGRGGGKFKHVSVPGFFMSSVCTKNKERPVWRYLVWNFFAMGKICRIVLEGGGRILLLVISKKNDRKIISRK